MAQRCRSVSVLISQKTEDATFVASLSESLGFEFQFFHSVDLAEQFVRARRSLETCNLFVDASDAAILKQFTRQFIDLIGNEPDHIPVDNISLIVNPMLRAAERQTFAHYPRYGALVFRQYGDAVKAGRYFSRIFSPSMEKGPFSMDLGGIDEKAFALGAIENHIKATSGFRERMLGTVITTIDELLLNALIDAQQESKDPQALKTPHRVNVEVRHGDGSVSITVSDDFGSFDRCRALAKILASKDLDEKVREIHPDEGSRLGIGLAHALKIGASLSFRIVPGVRTEVTVSFRETPSYREFRGQFQALTIRCA